jgi:L-2-hydroxyglutarate oxidase LhgO
VNKTGDTIDALVIGGGVTGLFTALKLAEAFDSVALVEKNSSCGQEVSSRNSEVIHAGIYYPENTLKSILCQRGRDLLYEYCRRRELPHRKTGKLIIARNRKEVPELEKIYRHGRLCGVEDLAILDQKEVRKREPLIDAEAAILSPSTGILNIHDLMKAVEYDFVQAGGMLALRSEVTAIEYTGSEYRIEINRNDVIPSARVVNCAGLASDQVAALSGIDTDGAGYRLHPCKGEYYSLNKGYPVSHLVYPVPGEELTGLGIHITLDLEGRIRFGPNAYYVDEIEYSQDERYHEEFFRAASSMLPGIEADDIVPEMTGIRPKLQGPGDPVRDFIIREESDRGLPGLVNCVGIESPGLTASPALAGMVRDLLVRST